SPPRQAAACGRRRCSTVEIVRMRSSARLSEPVFNSLSSDLATDETRGPNTHRVPTDSASESPGVIELLG
ncbi:hypothetical protein ACLOJK_002879, partial [Asimina triloba]